VDIDKVIRLICVLFLSYEKNSQSHKLKYVGI
jgi:hypothetical protein